MTECIREDRDRISGVVALLDTQWPKLYIATLVPLEAFLLVPAAFLLCERITPNLESMEILMLGSDVPMKLEPDQIQREKFIDIVHTES